MSGRALAPWLVPVAMIVGVLVAITNSVIVYGAVLMVVAWVVIPFGYAYLRRHGKLPQSVRSDAPGRRRFPGF